MFEGVLSAIGLLVAMLEDGTFNSMWFDPTKPRRDSNLKRKPTLTSDDVQAVLAQCSGGGNPDRRATVKVHFRDVIELEHMEVPTCPEHGVHFMRFLRDDDKGFAMDFHALKAEVNPDAKAAGAQAHCLACQKTIGRIVSHDSTQSPNKSSTTGQSGAGFFDLSGTFSTFLGDTASPFMHRAKKDQGPASPHSALKAGTSTSPSSPTGNTRKARANGKTNERRGSRPTEDNPETARSATTRPGFFGICCLAPCQCTGSKDRIIPRISAEGPRSRDSNGGHSEGSETNASSERSLSKAGRSGPPKSRNARAKGSATRPGGQASTTAN